jgi:cell division septation protein DedD
MISHSVNRSCLHGRGCLIWSAICATLFSLAGCIEAELSADAGQTPASTIEPAQIQPDLLDGAVPGYIEPSLRPDPDAFHAVGMALWDGTRTMHGIWISHPDVGIARQVRLTIDETGAQADAAMFRRDSNLSGSHIFISSEAAKALGITPGQATPITIVGLTYRTDTDIDPIPIPGSGSEPVVASETEVQDPVLDDIPVEGALVDQTEPEVTPAATASATENAATPEAQEPTPESTSIPPEATPLEAAPSGITADDEVLADPDPAPAGSENVSEPPETETIDEDTQPAYSVPMPPLKASPAPEVTGAITDGTNFIHAGVFGQSGNATRLVKKLHAADLPVIEVPLTLGERKLTRVLVGPYQTMAERDAALKTIMEIGPADATPGSGPNPGSSPGPSPGPEQERLE